MKIPTSVSPSPPRIMGISLGPRTFRHFMWGLQAIFWLLWFLLAYHAEPAQSSVNGPLVFSITHLPLLMGSVYLNYFWLIPRFLARQEYVAYGGAVLLLVALSQLIRWLLAPWVLQETEIVTARWLMAVSVSFILLIGSTLFKFVEGWFQVSQAQVQIQNEQLRSELRFLRAQVNPHFLFNTLNNLYTLTLTQDQRAPQMVAQLSDLMRYLIYDSSITRVKLLRELELLRNYIELQQLQHEEAKNVDFYVEGARNHHQIAPLLLISFLENCFKHGDLATNPQGWIAVSAIMEGDYQLHLSFVNSVSRRESEAPASGGIGLDNARRQLELNYPQRHHLRIEQQEGEFRVELQIELETAEELKQFPPEQHPLTTTAHLFNT